MYIIDMLLIFFFMIEFVICYGFLQIYFDYYIGINIFLVIINLLLVFLIFILENFVLFVFVFQVFVLDVNVGDIYIYIVFYNFGFGFIFFFFNVVSEYMYNFLKGFNVCSYFRVY